MLAAPELETKWTVRADDPRPLTLRLKPDRVMLWLTADPSDPHAVMLDGVDGRVLWTTPRIARHVGPLAPDPRGHARRRADDAGRDAF